MPVKVRVYELAMELGLSNKEILDLCDALGIGVKSHSTSIAEAQANRLRLQAQRHGLVRAPEPRPASVISSKKPPPPKSPPTKAKERVDSPTEAARVVSSAGAGPGARTCAPDPAASGSRGWRPGLPATRPARAERVAPVVPGGDAPALAFGRAAPDRAPPAPGQRIGRYEVVERLGSGGFATVYGVRDPTLNSMVAAKVLADNWTDDDEIRTRFLNEAQLLRRIDSARVVTVHDIGELASGQPYFIMALADRGNLASRLRSDASVDVVDVVAVAEQLAECVGAIHSHDLIHRDIKPANLLIAASRQGATLPRVGRLLSPYERLILGDFGLAKDIALQPSGPTIAGGTGGYAAPEQMTHGGIPDRRTDLYAATSVMYQVITGTLPPMYDAASRSVPFDDEQQWMSDVLGAFFRRGMAFDQAHRHHSINAWHAELSAALASLGAGPVTSRTIAAPVPLPAIGRARD